MGCKLGSREPTTLGLNDLRKGEILFKTGGVESGKNPRARICKGRTNTPLDTHKGLTRLDGLDPIGNPASEVREEAHGASCDGTGEMLNRILSSLWLWLQRAGGWVSLGSSFLIVTYSD